MRARPEIAPYLIAQRMKHWLEITRCPLMNTKVPTWKARRNYRALVRRYPEIAARLGYTEALSFSSPLHGLWSPVQQQAPPAPQEVSTDIIDPPRQQKVGWAVSPAPSVSPGMVSLEDEIL